MALAIIAAATASSGRSSPNGATATLTTKAANISPSSRSNMYERFGIRQISTIAQRRLCHSTMSDIIGGRDIVRRTERQIAKPYGLNRVATTDAAVIAPRYSA